MELKQTTNDQEVVLQLSGRFDALEAGSVKTWFKEQLGIGSNKLLVNLEGVNFIDSTGLSTLIQGLKNCQEKGAKLRLCCLQQPVRFIFELTRLDKAFDIFIDEMDAYPG